MLHLQAVRVLLILCGTTEILSNPGKKEKSKLQIPQAEVHAATPVVGGAVRDNDDDDEDN